MFDYFDYFAISSQRPSFYSQFRPLSTKLTHKYLVLECAPALSMTEEIPPHFFVGVSVVSNILSVCVPGVQQKSNGGQKKNRIGEEQARLGLQ